MTEWTMNTAQLEKGMLIRRPSLDESLEVLNVRNGQAKIKLPDGKTSTIPATAEVEWSWAEGGRPEGAALPIKPEPVTYQEQFKQIHGDDRPLSSGTISTEWQTDWSLLSPGVKIRVLGEKGDFTVLRKTDSSARIKHDATGQIQSFSIGHKFMLIDQAEGAITGAAPSKPKGKSPKPRKGTKVADPEEDNQDKTIPTMTPATAPTLFDDEPTDEALAAIENGNDLDETYIEGIDDMQLDPASLEDLEDEDEGEDEDDTDNDDDTDKDPDEENEMPRPTTPAASKSRSSSLLTVGQISEHTGISYSTLMRYIRDHGDRLPSEGLGRARRFLPEAIDVFRQIRSETKGGRPSGKGSGSAGSGSKSAKPRQPKPASGIYNPVERSRETAAPYAAPAKARGQSSARPATTAAQPVSSGTIDQALASAIDHARAQIEGLQALIENLEAQRESLKLWS